VVEAIRLHRSRGRTETGTTLIEGPHLFVDAIETGFRIDRVFCLPGDVETRRRAEAAGLETLLVAEKVLGRLATTVHPQSPVAVVPIPTDSVPREGHLMVAWEVSDPGNIGTLIRIAAAFGFGFVSGPGSADPWAPKTLRSGAGAHFRTTIDRVDSLDDLRALERLLVAAVPKGGIHPAGLKPEPDTAVLVGSEADGLPQPLIEAADTRVTIPMPGGTESLNAAVAGAILGYQLTAADPGRVGEPGPARD
jgi:TrmH family RNA methyltransferase